MIPAKIYTITIPANGSFPLQVIGEMFKVLSASGAFRVTGDSFGELGALQPGQGLEDTPFQRLMFTDTSGGDNTLQVLVSGSQFIDDRITGEVSVIDGGRIRSLAGVAYSARGYTPSAAGMYAHNQLRNAPAAPVNLVLSQLLVGCSNAGQFFNIYRSTGFLPTVGPNGENKRLGGALSWANTRSESTGSSVPSVASTLIGSLCAPMFTTAIYKLTEPIIIPPGGSLIVSGTSVAADVQVTYEYFQDPL